MLDEFTAVTGFHRKRAGAAGMPAGWHRLAEQALPSADHIVLQKALNAARGAAEQVKRLEAALVEIVPTWSMAPVVDAFQAMRGVGFVATVIFVGRTRRSRPV
jgi:transposase